MLFSDSSGGPCLQYLESIAFISNFRFKGTYKSVKNLKSFRFWIVFGNIPRMEFTNGPYWSNVENCNSDIIPWIASSLDKRANTFKSTHSFLKTNLSMKPLSTSVYSKKQPLERSFLLQKSLDKTNCFLDQRCTAKSPNRSFHIVFHYSYKYQTIPIELDFELHRCKKAIYSNNSIRQDQGSETFKRNEVPKLKLLLEKNSFCLEGDFANIIPIILTLIPQQMSCSSHTDFELQYMFVYSGRPQHNQLPPAQRGNRWQIR